MSSVKDIMQARNEGIAYAYNLARDKGLEALKEDVAYRGLTGQSITYTKQEVSENYYKMAKHATQLSIAISVNVLLKEYGLTKSQVKSFKDSFDEIVKQCIDNTEKQVDIITIAEMQGIELLKEF